MIPPFLKEGDKIGIVSPAGRVCEAGLVQTVDVFKNWGLDVVIGEHAFDEYTYLASSDNNRLADLQHMIDDDDIKAVIASRGGYGSVRLLEKLRIEEMSHKWLIGFSDITAIHLLLNSKGIPSIHGMMANSPDRNRVADDVDVMSLHDALFGNVMRYTFATGLNDRKGACHGVLFGGNLSVITSLLGTPYSVHPNGKILFIEEIGECYYQIDRMMQQLKYSGVLSHISGLIIGGMTDIRDTTIPLDKSICDIVYDAIGRDSAYPVCFNFPAGHIGLENRALYFGIGAKLAIDDDYVSLEFNHL